ncbi:MAG: cysteine desulfurase family protein [Longimicrobiales bacterium]
MKPIYLDYAATTPVRAEVRDAMAPYLDQCFGNPSSTHRWGREAAAALADARHEIADVLGARFSEICFTRGGTESDNLAVCGRAAWHMARGESPSVAVSAVEHKAVLDAARQACADGRGCCTVVGVSPDGTVDVDAIDAALAQAPTVVSMMWVNNETGMILPVPEVTDRVKAAGGTMHTDAVQAVGKVPVRVDETPVDLLTVTGHKIYGPKGTGALFMRRGVEVAPLLHGGGQERTLRPGTEDVAGAVGLATALRLAVEERDEQAAHQGALRTLLETLLHDAIPDLRIHGGDARRAHHVVSVGVSGVDGRSLLMSLDLEGVAASGGSACQSGSTKGSHVVAALYGADDAYATLRFSFSRHSTEDDVRRAAEVTGRVVARLREGAPV